MANLWAPPSTDIEPHEWKQLEDALAGSKHQETVRKLQANGNAASRAADVLHESAVNQGHDQINGVLRQRRISFRLTRSELWTGGSRSNTNSRADRKIAFVRWDNEKGCAVNPPRHGDCAP